MQIVEELYISNQKYCILGICQSHTYNSMHNLFITKMWATQSVLILCKKKCNYINARSGFHLNLITANKANKVQFLRK
jgi:hypothetical protein